MRFTSLLTICFAFSAILVSNFCPVNVSMIVSIQNQFYVTHASYDNNHTRNHQFLLLLFVIYFLFESIKRSTMCFLPSSRSTIIVQREIKTHRQTLSSSLSISPHLILIHFFFFDFVFSFFLYFYFVCLVAANYFFP